MTHPTLTTSITADLTITLTGTYSPPIPERGPSYASGGEPAEPASVDDMTITGLAIEHTVWRLNSDGPYKDITTHDLLANIDHTTPHPLRALLDNLLQAIYPEAEEALLEEAEEW